MKKSLTAILLALSLTSCAESCWWS
ncbi:MULTISPECIES: lipoprotein [Haemophilus]